MTATTSGPVAFRGDLTKGAESALDVLVTKVGVGVTGHVAATGEPFLTGDAANCGIGHHIEGTARIEESLLAVPLRYGANVVGVLVLSKLGLDQFDADDVSLLEVLAGHASVALVNASLYEAQRREADGAKALLELSRELSAVHPARRRRCGRSRAARPAFSTCLAPRSGSPSADHAGLVCRSVWPDDEAAGFARPGDRLPPSASEPLSQRSEPFVLRHADFAQPGREPTSRAPSPTRMRLPRSASTPAGPRSRSRSTARTSLDETATRAARRHRRAGEDGAHERAVVRDARANVPLDRRSSRKRARGQGRVHVFPRPLDHGTWR